VDSGCESEVQGEGAGRVVITSETCSDGKDDRAGGVGVTLLLDRTDDDAVAGLRYIGARKRSKPGTFRYLHVSLRTIGLIVRSTLYLSELGRTNKSPWYELRHASVYSMVRQYSSPVVDRFHRCPVPVLPLPPLGDP